MDLATRATALDPSPGRNTASTRKKVLTPARTRVVQRTAPATISHKKTTLGYLEIDVLEGPFGAEIKCTRLRLHSGFASLRKNLLRTSPTERGAVQLRGRSLFASNFECDEEKNTAKDEPAPVVPENGSQIKQVTVRRFVGSSLCSISPQCVGNTDPTIPLLLRFYSHVQLWIVVGLSRSAASSTGPTPSLLLVKPIRREREKVRLHVFRSRRIPCLSVT